MVAILQAAEDGRTGDRSLGKGLTYYRITCAIDVMHSEKISILECSCIFFSQKKHFPYNSQIIIKHT